MASNKKFIEKTASTIDKAIEEALKEMNLTVDKAIIEIVDKGNKGLLGLGSKSAKVRVTAIENLTDKSKTGEISTQKTPNNYNDFKKKYISLYYSSYQKFYGDNEFLNKLNFINCFRQLYPKTQPSHVIYYLKNLINEINPNLNLTYDEILDLYQNFHPLYNSFKVTIQHYIIDKNSTLFKNNPLGYYFQAYYLEYPTSLDLFPLLKIYLQELSIIDFSLPYQTLLKLYSSYLKSKKDLRNLYLEGLANILDSFFNQKEVWPIEPKLTDLEIKAIKKICDKKILEISSINNKPISLNDLNIVISTIEFRKFVNIMLEAKCQFKFNKSFLKYYEIEFEKQNSNITKKECLSLFVSIFQENNDYSTYLLNFIKEYVPESEKSINIIEELNLMRKEIAINNKLSDIEDMLLKNCYTSNKYFNIDDIDNLTGLDFESFLKILFSKMGYTAKITKPTGDYGADLILSKLGRKIAVQAKRYNTKLDNTPIQEILGAKAYYKCTETMVVTNSYFTKKAIELAQVNNVQLIDRDDLIELLETYPIVKND